MSFWARKTLTVSCDHYCHLARPWPNTSLGGIDYPALVGTPLYAPASGILRVRDAGTGGWTLVLSRSDGVRFEAMHISRAIPGLVIGGAGVPVLAGQLAGWSGGIVGAPGAGSSTGPHIHEHAIVGGVRKPIESVLGKPGWASLSSEPIDRSSSLPEDYDMPRIYHQINTDGNQAYLVEGTFGFDIVSADHAKAICKGLGQDFTKVAQINEFDFYAISEAKRKDVAKLVSIVATAPQGSPDEVAAAVEVRLADDFAAVQANINDQPTEFIISPKEA